MENVIPNAGTLPRTTEADESELIHTAETGASRELIVDPDEDRPRSHVRAPELRRNVTKLAMTAAAVIGAAAGARLLFGETEQLMDSVSTTFVGTFGKVFLRQLLNGAAFLAAEFILGFFAFGDLAVWFAPFLYSAGTVLRVAAGPTVKLLPGGLFCLTGIVIGAAYSADMSGLLLKLTRGGTVYMDTRPQRSYALGFLACLAAVALGSLLIAVLSGTP